MACGCVTCGCGTWVWHVGVMYPWILILLYFYRQQEGFEVVLFLEVTNALLLWEVENNLSFVQRSSSFYAYTSTHVTRRFEFTSQDVLWVGDFNDPGGQMLCFVETLTLSFLPEVGVKVEHPNLQSYSV